ncbi:MAG: DUF4404 family protein [Pseudomonadota bacterium]
MSVQELTRLAEALQYELESADLSDAEARNHLQGLHDELEHRLTHPREDNQDEELIDRLREAVERFEAAHPRATGVISQIIHTLGNLGI